MQDLRFSYYVDQLAVDKAEDMTGTPRKVLLTGARGLDSVSDVKINGVVSPSVTITGPTTLEVQVPNPHTAALLTAMTFEVLSSRHTGRYTNRIVMDFGAQPERVEGFDLLVQLVLRKLLLTTGSNRFSPGEGAGLRKLRGSKLAQADAGRVQAAVYDGVKRTSEELRRMQARRSGFSSEEKLKSLSAGAVSIDIPRGTIAVVLHLTSEAGRSRSVPLVL